MTNKFFTPISFESLSNVNFKEYAPLYGDEIRLDLVGSLAADFEMKFVPRYLFDILLISSNTKIGFLVFRMNLTDSLLRYGGHLGFEIDKDYRGHHYASKAITLLKPFMRLNDLQNILVTCDDDNIASRKTIEKVGGQLLEITKNVQTTNGLHRVNCCYYLLSI